MQPNHKQDTTNQQLTNNKNEIQLIGKPKKKVRKQKQNPFEDFNMFDDEEEKSGYAKQQNEWIKTKTNPLSIQVTDHSKINKYYSHKSIQKYIQYLFTKTCSNPLWLSIKRQSQVQRIIFIDIEIENNIFHQYFNIANPKNKQNESIFRFLINYNKPQIKAIFKQTAFLKESVNLWEALLLYDHCQIKSDVNTLIEKLPLKLTQELFKLYQSFTLSEDERRFNLYPMAELPAYKQYYRVPECSNTNIPLQNKILIIDCEMVICDNNFELARTSIMNFEGELIYDEFFMPDTEITNYNTQYSGITEEILRNVKKKIQDLHEDIRNIMDKNTILVGHSLENDLHAMKLIHQKVIDTSVLFIRKNGSKMKLKTLAFTLLNKQIQVNSHCSSQDCKATLDLVRYKIQSSQEKHRQENKIYHLLKQLLEQGKNVIMVDSDLEFIKHRKEYFKIKFQEIQFTKQNQQSYIATYCKHLSNTEGTDIILSKIRKTTDTQQWQNYYQRIDRTLQKIYNSTSTNSVFFINFQVNNNIEIYPQNNINILQRRRPFSLIFVKNQ